MGFKPRTGAERVNKPRAAGTPKKAVQRQKVLPVEPLDDVIRRTIANALAVHGSLRAAARALEIPYSSLRDKAEKYGLISPAARKQSR